MESAALIGLTVDRNKQMTEITVVTDEKSFVETAADAPCGVRIPIEISISVLDPFDAYRRVRSDDSEGFYLETTGGQSGWGYFGTDPIERIQVGSDAVSIEGSATIAESSPSFSSIDALLKREQLVRGDCSVPYPCGAFGWLSYDIARELETIPETALDEGLPRLQLGVFDRLAAWTEPREGEETTLHVTACPIVEGDPTEVYESSRERAVEFARQALSGSIERGSSIASNGRATFESECGQAAFAERVHAIKRYIRAGDTFQTNVSHRLTAPVTVDPVAVFDALRRVNPAPYSGLLEFRDIDLVSASPELLLDVDGEHLRTEPIAGTRPRGETPEEDADLEDDLLSDEKERAEHAMLVDLERNDLGKVCEYGSVEVTDYRRVDRYSEVMHLVSLVEGTRGPNCSVADAAASLFPGGTITGAPKPRTMEIIDELERTQRGPYTGSVGIFGFDDRATLNITIRTLVRRNDAYYLRVGSGIVHDSIPEREYQETLDKARALLTAVDEALGEQASFAIESTPDVAGGTQ